MKLHALPALVCLAACGSSSSAPSPAIPTPHHDIGRKSVVPPPAVDPEEKKERDFLDQIAEALDTAQDKIDRTADMPRLPQWAFQNGIGGEKTVEPQSPAAERALHGANRPRIQAVAMLWIATRQQLTDLRLLEPFLDSTEQAGKFPQRLPTQAATRDFDHITWIDQTLGQVSLWAIGSVLYRDFADAAAYRAWRTAQGDDLLQSYDYWKNRLERTWDEQRTADLEELRTANPEMYFRVVANGHADWVEPAALVETARDKVGRTNLMSIVRGQPSWSELSGNGRDEVTAWTFDHWHDLFGDEQSSVLLELWMTMAYGDTDWLRTRLAIATGDAYPDRRREILVELLDHPPGKRIGPAIAQLALHHFKQEKARIGRWFYAPEGPDAYTVDNRVAIVEALAADDKRGRATLKVLVTDRRFRTDDQRVIAAIARAVTAWGATLDAGCQEPLQLAPLPRKGEALADTEIKAAAARRAACLKSEISWLRQQR